ncbi:hypothetical protein BGW80DRAFT_710801 [Lactifluus volemus]|nr:hypothetical protein BGW80DRAFT_710801 [Lactifluus volemus]
MQTRTHTYKRSCVHRARMIILTHRICHFSYYRHDPNTANSWLEDLLFAWHGRIFRHISIIARGTTQGGTSQTKATVICEATVESTKKRPKGLFAKCSNLSPTRHNRASASESQRIPIQLSIQSINGMEHCKNLGAQRHYYTYSLHGFARAKVDST